LRIKILSLDCETNYGNNEPWEEGFYLTNVGAVGNFLDSNVFWFHHISNLDPWQDQFDAIQALIDEADIIIGQNLKYDMHVLRHFGISFEGKALHCTMIADYLINGQDPDLRYDLGSISVRWGGEEKLDRVKARWEMGEETYDIPARLLHEYVLDDCQKVFDIYVHQIEKVKELGLDKLVALQCEFQHSLCDMELNGIIYDTSIAMEVRQEFFDRAEQIANELREIIGYEQFNPESPKQLGAALYGGELKMLDTEWVYESYKTKPYTRYYERNCHKIVQYPGLGFKIPKEAEGIADKETIKLLKCKSEQHRHIKDLLLEFSKVAKIAKTILSRTGNKGLLTKVQADGKIHPSFNMAVTATGRLTSSNPNGQNLDTNVKRPIVPRYDLIMQMDLSQIEWRGAAQLCVDDTMIHEINSGIDQHGRACTELMELPLNKTNRKLAKFFNFRMIYGGSAYGFYMDHKMPEFPLVKWVRIVTDFYARYPKLEEWHNEIVKWVTEGNVLRLPTGRWFAFKKPKLKDGFWQYSPAQIKNYPVQGLAGGDILPLACVIIRRGLRERGLDSCLILTVHDSIVFDVVKEERDELARLCYTVVNNLPTYIKNYFHFDWFTKIECEVEVGPNYADLTPLTEEEL
jgi:DNA polymerase-1